MFNRMQLSTQISLYFTITVFTFISLLVVWDYYNQSWQVVEILQHNTKLIPKQLTSVDILAVNNLQAFVVLSIPELFDTKKLCSHFPFFIIPCLAMGLALYLITYHCIIHPLKHVALHVSKSGIGNLEFCNTLVMTHRGSQPIFDMIHSFVEDYSQLAADYQSLEMQQQATKEITAELAKAIELKSDIIATLSHEIKTPLTAIIACAEVILGQGEGAYEVIDNSYDIYQSAHHLLDLVTDILDLSNIEKGTLQLHYSYFEVIEILNVLNRVFSPLIKKGNLILSIVIPDQLPAIYADKNKLKQVFMNLLSNAIKFTPPGGMITLKVVYQTETNQLIVSINDTGKGIPANFFNEIFNKFFQLDIGVRHESGGVGLGLAITKHLIELHGGNIWLESTLGKGSTFFFKLPICRLPKN